MSLFSEGSGDWSVELALAEVKTETSSREDEFDSLADSSKEEEVPSIEEEDDSGVVLESDVVACELSVPLVDDSVKLWSLTVASLVATPEAGSVVVLSLIVVVSVEIAEDSVVAFCDKSADRSSAYAVLTPMATIQARATTATIVNLNLVDAETLFSPQA